MTTYQINVGTSTCAVTVEEDVILQSGQFFSPYVGRHFALLREHCRLEGWPIVPIIENLHRHTVEFNGDKYEFNWLGDKITSIHLWTDNGWVEVRFKDLPEAIKRLLSHDRS